MSHVCPNFTGCTTNRSITSITNSNPASVTTSTDHGYSDGEAVIFFIETSSGMTELDSKIFKVNVTSPNTFELSVDSTSYTTFTPSNPSCDSCISLNEFVYKVPGIYRS